MRIVCGKCGEVFHYGGRWHPDQGELICGDCLGIDDMAEEARYTGGYGEREVDRDDD